MRKIGLYIQRQNGDGVRDMVQRIKPSVVLLHLDGGDIGAWLRTTFPDMLIIGRLYWTQQEQDDLFRASGGDIARLVLSKKGAGLCDAFMLFNECMGSPVDHGGEPPFIARAKALDRLQVDFRAALVAAGKEAVAWNFGAGNWPTAEHYKEHFPLTLGAYKYLGFHAYGWPKLANADPWWRSSFAETMRVIDDLPRKNAENAEVKAILTEMAVTRAYANPGPDEGWLSNGDGAPLSLDAYAGDLAAVNSELNKRTNVVGGCLFNAAPEVNWQSFAVTPDLVTRLAALPETPVIVTPPPKPPVPPVPPTPPPPKPPAQTAEQLVDAALVKMKEAVALLIQAKDTFRD